MATHDDLDINISQNEESELSEKEYSDILGLEGMAGGGEAALEETEEEKEEDIFAYVFAEHHGQKQRPAYRRYTYEDESEERQEAEINVTEHRENERKREDLFTNVSLDDDEQLDRDEDITSIPTETSKIQHIHTDFDEVAYSRPIDIMINRDEQIIHSELRILENIVQESTQIPMIEHRQNEGKLETLSINISLAEPDISAYESSIPLDQMENWKNSSISEREAVSNEKFNTAEYWNYLQTNVSEYAHSVQLENEQLYRDVEVAGISAVFSQYEPIYPEIGEEKAKNQIDNPIKSNEQIVHSEIQPTEVFVQESMQISIPEQYTSPNKIFRQEEMVEVFSYAKKQEENKTVVQSFESVKREPQQEIAQGQSEKTTRDVNIAGRSNAEGQKDTAAEQGKVDIEASIQAHELKEETAREFHTSVDIDNKITNVYEQGKTAVRSMSEDDLIAEGHRETEKYIKPVTLAVAMFASSSAISNIKSELEKTTKAVEETILLIEQGKLSLSDLNGKKKELAEKLKKLELPKETVHRIIRGRKDSYDLMVTQASLVDLDMRKQILEPKQREHLNSKQFFDMRKKETHELVALYFKNSKNEVLLKTDIMNLSVKDSKKLERSAKKNCLTSRDISAIRVARKLGNLKRARIAHGVTKTKAYIRTFYDLSRNMKDEMIDEGLQTISVSQKVSFASYSVIKAGIAAGRVSVQLINKIPAVRWIESKAIAGGKYVGKAVVQGIKEAGSVVTTPVKKAVTKVQNTAKTEIEKKVSKKTIAEIRKARAKATEKGKKAIVKAKKVAGGVKKGAKAVGKTTRIVSTPIRFIGSGVNKIISFLNAVKIKIAIGFLALAAAYMLLIAIMCMLIAIGSSSGEGIATTILSRDTTLVATMVNTLQGRIDAREAEAVELTETVKSPEVLGGRTIDRYGYQKEDGTWTDGYTITHVDKNGIQIASGANNSKDVIILIYLLMQADFDSYTNARDKLLLDMWDLMNPDCTYDESDIYTCSVGCETVYYACNDSATLTNTSYTYETASAMQGYIDEGVFFKESIKKNTYGDSYKSVCNGHDHGSSSTTVTTPSGCDNYAISLSGTSYTVTCNGHTINHGSKTTTGHPEAPSGCSDYTTTYSSGKYTLTCKGHTTSHTATSGSISTPTGCDSYSTSLSGTTYTTTCNKTGGSTHNHGSKTGTGEADVPSTDCDNYTVTYYCSGHSVEACFGHKDIEVSVTTIFMEQMFESNELPTSSTGAHYSSYWTRLSKFKSNTEAWNSGWTENYIAWANSLYNQNWTTLYGIDPLGGISMCARFTEEEIAVILAENGLTDRNNPQYRACYFALSKVGYPYSQALRDSGNAYDCSSLCYYAWAYAGKNITYEGSNTAAQEAKGLVNNGILVYDSTDSGSSYNQVNLQSGDLIFYSYENNDRYLDISHVAIYIGNGMVVEARGTAYGVVYREVPNISKIVLICRVRY